MGRDRLPDLLALSRKNPKLYFEPEIHEEIPLPPDVQQLLQRLQVLYDTHAKAPAPEMKRIVFNHEQNLTPGRTEKILKFLNELRGILNELKVQHQGVLTSSSVLNMNLLREKITLLSNRFSALARKAEAILRRIELSEQEKLRYSFYTSSRSSKPPKADLTVQWKQASSSVEVSWPQSSTSAPVYVPAEIRIKIVMHDVLSNRLTNLVEQFYSEQRHYYDTSQKKIERQLSILGKTVKQEDIEKFEDESVPLLHSNIYDDRHVSKEMKAQLKEVAHFEKEILQLERNITQLHNAFMMISKLVHEQGQVVDRIEHHIIMASDYIDSSNQHLKKAGKLQNKYRKKKCIIAIVIILILLIIAAIIAISIVVKRHNVTVNNPRPSHYSSKG